MAKGEKKMAEYIERERAYENMVSEMFGTGFLERATNAIKDVPTADVQEVRRGHWNYCPHCGARIDESATDTNVGS